MKATLIVLDKGDTFPIKFDASYIKQRIQEEERIPIVMANYEIVNITVHVRQKPTTKINNLYNTSCDTSSTLSPVVHTISSDNTNYSSRLALSQSCRVSTFTTGYSTPLSSISNMSTSSSDENGTSSDSDSRNSTHKRICTYSTREQKSHPSESLLCNQSGMPYQHARSSTTKKRNRQSHEGQKPSVPENDINHFTTLSDNRIRPTENDIICGKKSGKEKQRGNKYYREQINKNEKKYKSLSSKNNKQKREIVKEIYQMMRSSNCRFIEKIDGLWVEWTEEKAKNKIAQALRENRLGESKSSKPLHKSSINSNAKSVQRENDDGYDSFKEDIDLILEDSESLSSFELIVDLDIDSAIDEFDATIYIDSKHVQRPVKLIESETTIIYTSFPQKNFLLSPATQWYNNMINYFFREYFDASEARRNDIEDKILDKIQTNNNCNNVVYLVASEYSAISVTNMPERRFLIRSSLLALQNMVPTGIWNNKNNDNEDEQDPRDSDCEDNNEGKYNRRHENHPDRQNDNSNRSSNGDVKRTDDGNTNGFGAKLEQFKLKYISFRIIYPHLHTLLFDRNPDQFKDSKNNSTVLPYQTDPKDIVENDLRSIETNRPSIQSQFTPQPHRDRNYIEKYQQLVQIIKNFLRDRLLMSKTSDLNIQGKKLDFRTSQLSSDTFSLMMTTEPLTAPWVFALFIFVVQITLIWLLLGWQISTVNVALNAIFNTTFNTTLEFSVLFTMITAVRSIDVIVPITNLFSLWYTNYDEWSKVIPQKDVEALRTISSNLKLWALQIVLPNVLKMLKGIFAIEGMLLILLENKSDVLLNIAAINGIAELDNLVFAFTNIGCLGFNLQRGAKSATKTIKKEGRSSLVIGSFLIMLIIVGSHLKIMGTFENDNVAPCLLETFENENVAPCLLEALSRRGPNVLGHRKPRFTAPRPSIVTLHTDDIEEF